VSAAHALKDVKVFFFVSHFDPRCHRTFTLDFIKLGFPLKHAGMTWLTAL
jgi:hypothetical protein